MSRNTKLILIIVLAVVLVACVILALTMPEKSEGNDTVITGTNDTAVESMGDTEVVGTEGSGDDLDVTIGVDGEDSTKPSGNETSGNGNSGNGNSGNGNSDSGNSTDETQARVELEIDFDDLLEGVKKDDDDTVEETTAATEESNKNDSDGPAKVEDQDIVIEF